MARVFYDKTDAILATGSANFAALLVASAQSYHVSTEQAAAYAALDLAYQNSYRTAIEPATRTSAAIAAKDSARALLVRSARALAGLIRSLPLVTDEQLIELGLSARSAPVPAPVPTTVPLVEVEDVVGNTIHLRLRDSGPGHRSKPAGATACMIYSHVGEQAPSHINDWTFRGVWTRSRGTISFDNNLPPFSRVWITALFVNRRGQQGPACTPVPMHLGIWAVQTSEVKPVIVSERLAA